MRGEVIYKVFLGLRKAYDSLDKKRCMYIVVGYRIGPRTDIILQFYWEHLSMVEWAGYHERRQYQKVLYVQSNFQWSSFTPTTSSSPRPDCPTCRRHWVSLRGYLTGLFSILMLKKLWGWYSRHLTCVAGTWRRHTRGGLRE